MAGAAIEVRNVSRRFHLAGEAVWALKDVTVTFGAGEFTALIGRSGSGKTTLLNIIAGLDEASEGEVLIDGQSVQHMSEKELNELRRHRLGFVFQSFGLLPLLSAQENVELPLRIGGFRRDERVKRARRLLDMVGLGRRADHRPYELSGGEQQRVAIARALATGPSLILADEPTGELDSATATAIFTLMREIARTEGVTVLTCTHDRLVIEMADRVEELADGRLVTGQRHAVLEHVLARERSPFAAPMPSNGGSGEAPTLSSLLGADTRVFAPREEEAPRQEPQRQPAAEPEAEEGPATETHPENDDGSRWARPRGQG